MIGKGLRRAGTSKTGLNALIQSEPGFQAVRSTWRVEFDDQRLNAKNTITIRPIPPTTKARVCQSKRLSPRFRVSAIGE